MHPDNLQNDNLCGSELQKMALNGLFKKVKLDINVSQRPILYFEG